MYNSLTFSTFTEMCNYHHNQFYNIFITTKRNTVPINSSPSICPQAPSSRQLLIYFLSLYICLFYALVIDGIWYVMSCHSVLSLSTIFLKFIHVETYQYFISIYCSITFHWMDISHFICSSVDYHLGCFHFLAIIILLWPFIYKFFCGRMFSFILSIHLGVEYWVNSTFNLLRNYQTFPKWLHHFTFPLSNVWEFQFLCLLHKHLLLSAFWL